VGAPALVTVIDCEKLGQSPGNGLPARMPPVRPVTVFVALALGAVGVFWRCQPGLNGLPWAAFQGDAERLRAEIASSIAVRTAQAATLAPKLREAQASLAAPAAVEMVPRSEPVTANVESSVPLSLPLLSVGRETPIYAAPSKRARKVGYVSLGGRLSAAPESLKGSGCAGGWHSVSPFGYVCFDERVSINPKHPVTELATRAPARIESLPYSYARAKRGGIPLYTRIPSADERALQEGAGRRGLERSWRDTDVENLPSSLALGRPTPTLYGYARPAGTLFAERTLAKSSFAIARVFEVQGQRFGMTPDLLLLPLDQLTRVTPPRFRGVRIPRNQTLPVAFVKSRTAYLYRLDEAVGALTLERKLEFRDGFVALSERRFIAGHEYVRSAEGLFARVDQLRLIEGSPAAAPWLKREKRFIDVSLKDQALVAYEDGHAVFATLISSGLESNKLDAPSRATVTGQFRIHTKHVTAKMSGDDVGDEYALPDVPYVQYFHGSFALHAAYWHDAFGTPQSHGCINLSPEDARFLFGWTEPPVPPGWHGAMDPVGTMISIHE